MARTRSPNYPAIGLPEAIDRLKTLFPKVQRQTVTREQVIEAMGYEGVHGGSLGAISALLKYGLLESGDDGVCVGERGLAILHPQDENEREEAVTQAAFEPPLFSELHDRFLGEVPSDDKLRSYLIRKGFSSGALGRVIRSYRETMDLVTEGGEGYNSDHDEFDEDQNVTPAKPVRDRGVERRERPQALPEEGIRVSLTDNRLEVSANLLDGESVDRLINVLQANKVLLPKKKPDAVPDDVQSSVNLQREQVEADSLNESVE